MKRINVAAVGSNGHQIIGLLDGLEEAQLVGIAECDPARLPDYEKAHGKVLAGVPRFDSLDALLRSTDCELEDSFRCTQIMLEAQLSASAGGTPRRLRFE